MKVNITTGSVSFHCCSSCRVNGNEYKAYQKYCELIGDKVRAMYPSAEIEFNWANSLTHVRVWGENYTQEQISENRITAVVDEVYRVGDFWKQEGVGHDK